MPLPRLPRALRTLALALATALPALAAGAPLPAEVARILAEAGLPPEALGLVVAPAGPGPRFIAHAAEQPLQPGSTMKLVTTLVALEQLGPTFRTRTRLLAQGRVHQGVLHGDLVLQGEGDPDLDLPALRGLLQRARQRGMVGWRGRLVLDRSAFEPARPDLHLPPFDDAPEFEYNTVPDALMVDGNLLRIDLRVGEQGLQLWPATPIEGLHLSHAMTLVEGGCERWEALWKPPLYTPASWGRDAELRLQGAWPVGCERRVSLNVLPRNEHIERVVRTLWRELGGHWQGEVVDGRAPPDAHVLAEHASRPLGELVRAINKPSDNALTRLVALALGARSPGAAGDPTLTRAGQAIRRWMHSRGIDERGFVFDNGSGLSRSERLTPAQLEAVVRAGLASPWAPEFLASLPLVGLDGTMRRRLQDGPAAGRARLKTGTLRNVVALAGTLPDAAGRPLVLVAILNHERVRPAAARPVIDAIVDWVSRQDLGARLAPAATARAASAP